MKFKQSIKEFLQSKTNWAGITMIGSGVVGFASGVMDAVVSFQTIAGGFGLMFIKDAIAGAKNGKAT